jgi:hypothetical protein
MWRDFEWLFCVRSDTDAPANRPFAEWLVRRALVRADFLDDCREQRVRWAADLAASEIAAAEQRDRERDLACAERPLTSRTSCSADDLPSFDLIVVLRERGFGVMPRPEGHYSHDTARDAAQRDAVRTRCERRTRDPGSL